MRNKEHFSYKFHYFYKITNNINGKFYYGIHSTNNLEDGYMGSGVLLHKAYKKYGIENFTKEIIKFFPSREECGDYEAKIITEGLIRDKECYNLTNGGININISGMITVRDNNGNVFLIYPDDERWIKGEVVGVTKGQVNCFDKKTGEYTQIDSSDYYNNKERYLGTTNNKIPCRIKGTNEKYKLVSREDFYNNRNLYETPSDNLISCKDNFGNFYRVSNDNEDYKNGKLKPLWNGLKHSEETKEKMRKKHKENGDQKGVKNSQYGTCWITKDGLNKKIKKEDKEEYLSNGWKLGRIIKKES